MPVNHSSNTQSTAAPSGPPIDSAPNVIVQLPPALLAEYQAAIGTHDDSQPDNATLKEFTVQLAKNMNAHFALINAAGGICIRPYIMRVRPKKLVSYLPETNVLLGEHLFRQVGRQKVSLRVWFE